MRRERLVEVLRRRARRDPLARAVRDAARALDVQVLLVGGSVRDAALGERSSDLDLAAGAGTQRLVRQLARAWGTRAFRFRKRGVTTWRFVVDGRRVDLVDAGRRGLPADLARRELTINAIAYDIVEERILDPFRGLADLRAGRLRLPRPGVMLEDPVRALRAARFLAQLPAFRLHPQARAEAMRAAPRLRRAPAERVREELDKLLGSRAPERGLEALERLGVLDVVLPELAPLKTCIAGAERPDVWSHTVDAIAKSARPGRLPGAAALGDFDSRRRLRWALLLHDIAKPETLAYRDDGRPTFHGHEALGASRAMTLLRRLRVPQKERRRIERLIQFHLRPSQLAEAAAPLRGLRRLVRESEDDLPLLVLHAACDALASGSPDADTRWRRLRKVLVQLLELHAGALERPLPRLVDGNDLMRALDLAPGPVVGRVLAEIREAQEEGRVSTPQQALAFARALRLSS